MAKSSGGTVNMSGDSLHIGLCPRCGSSMLSVLDTNRPHRIIRCKICKYKWRTIEVNCHKPGWLKSFVREIMLSPDAKALPGDFQKDLLKFLTSATST